MPNRFRAPLVALLIGGIVLGVWAVSHAGAPEQEPAGPVAAAPISPAAGIDPGRGDSVTVLTAGTPTPGR